MFSQNLNQNHLNFHKSKSHANAVTRPIAKWQIGEWLNLLLVRRIESAQCNKACIEYNTALCLAIFVQKVFGRICQCVVMHNIMYMLMQIYTQAVNYAKARVR